MSGLSEEADDDICAVFESKRIGGGTVEKIHHLLGGSVLITFHDDAGEHGHVVVTTKLLL